MTHRAILTLSKRIGTFPIEWPAAAMLAGAVAFATLALPDWRFERAVAMTGLPALISAADPPLGVTARALAALVFASLAFAGSWLVLRSLERRAVTGDFPTFRAADRHPDAPRRRPIRADAEFGAPVPIEAEPSSGREPVSAEPMPSFLTPQFAEYADFEPEPASPEPGEAVDTPATASMEWPPTERPVAVAPTAAMADAPSLGRESIVVARDDEPREDVSELMARLESGLSNRSVQVDPVDEGDGARDELLGILGDLDRVRDTARV